MKLTPEQEAIIGSSGDIKINAVAGSGKTTTLIEYARSRPANSRILYLAFNKSVKLEAQRKFAESNLRNVTVETAHSLAFRHVVMHSRYEVTNSYKTYEIAEMLGLSVEGEKHAAYIVANHINKFMAYFCNSAASRVQELNYREVVTDAKALHFVNNVYPYLETQTRILLAKMDRAEIGIIHDFYLKKFQLSNPILPYDFILFDEGQDASPAMLDVFMKQRATKVIVGDTHQQIYGWRYAINSLEKTDFREYPLSNSFRFGPGMAALANDVLQMKTKLDKQPSVLVKGLGTSSKIQSKAIIARTNLGLLLRAIDYVIDRRNKGSLYFEGNIASYTYAEDGASLYDVLNLYNRKPFLIRDKLIQQMKTMEELEEYIEKTEDPQLSMMVEVVKEYGNEIPGLIQLIKDRHINSDDKAQADVVFSTVHRCKGMEYDQVELANDFITEERLEKFYNTPGLMDGNEEKLSEEINLLYVAVTRTKAKLQLPAPLLPVEHLPDATITILAVAKEEAEKTATQKPKPVEKKKKKEKTEKAYDVQTGRETHENANAPWTPEQDKLLKRMYWDQVSIKQMAAHFGRTKGAIASRIKKLGIDQW